MYLTNHKTGSRGASQGKGRSFKTRSQRAQNLGRMIKELDLDLVCAAFGLQEDSVRSLADDRTDWDAHLIELRERLQMVGLPKNWFDLTNAYLTEKNVAALRQLAGGSYNRAPTRRTNFKNLLSYFDGRHAILADALEITAFSLLNIANGDLPFDDQRFGHLNPRLVMAGFPDEWLDTPNAAIADEWIQRLETMAGDTYEEGLERHAMVAMLPLAMTNEMEPPEAFELKHTDVPVAPLEDTAVSAPDTSADAHVSDSYEVASYAAPLLEADDQRAAPLQEEPASEAPYSSEPAEPADTVNPEVMQAAFPTKTLTLNTLRIKQAQIMQAEQTAQYEVPAADAPEIANQLPKPTEAEAAAANPVVSPSTEPVKAVPFTALGRLPHGVALNFRPAGSAPTPTTSQAGPASPHVAEQVPQALQAESAPKKPRRPREGTMSAEASLARARALSQLLEHSRRGAKIALWRDLMGRSLPYWANLRNGEIKFNDLLAERATAALQLPTDWLDNPTFPPVHVAKWLNDETVPLPTSPADVPGLEAVIASQEGITRPAGSGASRQAQPVVVAAQPTETVTPPVATVAAPVDVAASVAAPVASPVVSANSPAPVVAMTPVVQAPVVHTTVPAVALATAGTVVFEWTPKPAAAKKAEAGLAVQTLKSLLEALGREGIFTEEDAYRLIGALVPKV